MNSKPSFKRGDKVKWGTFIGKVRGLIAPNESSTDWKVMVGGFAVPVCQITPVNS